MPDTSVRKLADPHLHAIRQIARHLKDEDWNRGKEIETARFNLYCSLESEDYDQAMSWLNSLEVGLAILEKVEHPARGPIKKALTQLRELLEDETEVPEEAGA